MSITGKLKSVLLTYSVVISISINLLTTGSEAASGSLPPPPPPPPPIEGLKNFKSPMNQSRYNSKGDQSQHNNKSHTTSSIKTPPPQSLEVSIPTGEFGKKYAELINPNAGQQNLKIEFSKNITSLIRDELTLKNLTADADKILALFSKKDDVILGEAKEKYKELIQDPYIAQFISINNQKTGDFLDNKLFEESLEEATLRLLSLEPLDAQRKQEILSKQGDILGQLKFINENSRILGAYGKTASTDISKKLPKELPKILSKQGDILGQLKFINDHSEILGAYGKTASTDISKKLPKELPKILSKQGDILGQLKFINDHSEILGEHSKAILKDTLKKLSTKLDKISSKQLVGFILDENKINTNLKNVPFSKKEVRELIDSLNNKILEKIFLQDDGTITEQDLTRILQKYKETDLIKNLTKAIVYIDGNTSNETVNKTLAKGLENTTPEQQGLILNVLTHNIRIRKVLISKIERERKQDQNQRLKERTKDDPLLDGLKKVLAQRKYINQETIEEQLARRKQETAANLNVWNRVRQNIPDSQNDNQNAQDENNQKWKEDNQEWKEDNQEWKEDKNNNDIDKIIKANQELEQAVSVATRKSNEMDRLIKDNIIKNATICQGYLKGAEDQLTLVRDKGKELIENAVQAFKIIPKEYQDDMDENWQNYLSLEEITELNTLEAKIKPLKSQQNKFGKFTSKTDLLEFRIKQAELQILSERLREDVVTKQKKQLVQKYVDTTIARVKKAVEKIEITLENLNKKKENKHDNAESIPLISKEILEAQERLKKAEEKLAHITFKHIIAQQRKVDSSDDDSDDDWDDDDKKAIKRKKELENAQEEIKQAKKNLEDAETKDAERKQQEAEAKRQEDLKRKQEEERQQREDAEHQQRQDAERQQREDAERQQRQDAERQQRQDAERQQREDAEHQQRQDAEHQQREDAERQQRQDAEHQQRQDAERQQREDAERQQRQDAERQQRQDAEHQQRQDAERQQRQDAERQQRQDAEHQQRQDAERQQRQDAERQQRQDAEHQQRQDAERQQRQDAERQQRQDAEHQQRQDAERQQRQDAEHQQRQDAERQQRQDAEHQQRQDAEHQQRQDAEHQQRQDAEHQQRQDAEHQQRQDAERQQREDAERQQRQDAERQQREDAERQQRENAERQQREDAERQRQEEQNRQEQEHKRLADKAEAECLEDMASMFKNAEDEAEQKEEAKRQRQEEQNRQEQERKHLADEEAEQKEEAKRQRQEEQNRQEQEHKRLADEEAEQKEEAEEEELTKDIVLESKDKAIDVSLKTEEIAEQDEATQRQQVSDDTSRKVAILVKATSTLHKPVHYNILSDRLKVAAISAGDEEASINRGVWISGLYGINKQGAWKNIPKYQGRTTGVTIGADAEFINSHDVIGIAYSRLESQVKYNKKLGKTAINGHLLSIYGLKALIKGFSLQAITSYGHNYIKNKSKSINNIIGKYQNNNLSFESSLNYKYSIKYGLYLIPNIGFKYDYSRASNYKEYNIDIENLMIQKKSNQSFESSLGGKIVFKPIATTSNIVLTPSLYGNIEHHFNNKNTKVNAKATFKGQTLQETIIIPKQPKLGYNIGSNILMSRKNINVLLEYNYYTHRKYQSHQGLVKLKINL
ncbi:hypothetical protein RAS_01390 [Rickettsia asiatica]|uniref:Autotransporter domain-containing protein n=2 Tax=Rickettsia asiatica TaxID=238800 RepID=A0A510G692_9RICK|nr:autotransporter domain-containing protein [Rickettsia asiatica]BBJ31030.1 hypothetical protein RAS_01390 [Rickettsia asiatica]